MGSRESKRLLKKIILKTGINSNKDESKSTKYFGNVKLDFSHTGNAFFSTVINGSEVVVLWSNYNRFENKIHICWEFVDKYVEIVEIIKKAIVESLLKQKGTAHSYFKTIFEKCFDEEDRMDLFNGKDFDELNVITFIENYFYPHMNFKIEHGIISIDFEFYWTIGDPILITKMDMELNIKGFEINYGS